MSIAILTKKLVKEIPIQIDMRDASEEFYDIINDNVEEIKSQYNIIGFLVSSLYELRSRFSQRVSDKSIILNQFDLPIATTMPFGSERLGRLAKQEKKAVTFLKENRNFCVETLLSPKRILDVMKCVKWKISICLDIFNAEYTTSKWLFINYPELIKLIQLNWRNNFKVNPRDISFMGDFKNIIDEYDIPIVLEYLEPVNDSYIKRINDAIRFINKCLETN